MIKLKRMNLDRFLTRYPKNTKYFHALKKQ